MEWKQGEHVTLIGPTGSGKTYQAMALAKLRKYTLVVSSKAKDETIADATEDFDVVNVRKGLTRGGQYVYYPPHGLGREDEAAPEVETLLDQAYNQGGWTIIIDEAWFVARVLKLERKYQSLLRLGRSQGISVVSATQRVVDIPREAIDQATYLILFRPKDGRSIDYVEKIKPNVANVRGKLHALSEHDYITIKD